MGDSELLQGLRRLAHEQRRDELVDPSYELRAADGLSEQELEELRMWSEQSEETKWAFEAAKPLDDKVRTALVDNLLSQHLPPDTVEGEEDISDTDLADVSVGGDAAAGNDNARHQQAGRWRIAAWIMPFMAAAALLLWWLFRAGTPLPAYQIAELSAGNRVVRSAEPRPASEPVVIRLGAGESFSLVIRPAEAAQGVALATYRARGDELQPWAVPVTTSSSGAFLIDGSADELLDFEPGEWTLVFVLARSGRLPADLSVISAALASPQAAKEWQLLAQPVHIRSQR